MYSCVIAGYHFQPGWCSKGRMGAMNPTLPLLHLSNFPLKVSLMLCPRMCWNPFLDWDANASIEIVPFMEPPRMCRLLSVLWTIVDHLNILSQLQWMMPLQPIAIYWRFFQELISLLLVIQLVEELPQRCSANSVRTICQCHVVAFSYRLGRIWALMAFDMRPWKMKPLTFCPVLSWRKHQRSIMAITINLHTAKRFLGFVGHIHFFTERPCTCNGTYEDLKKKHSLQVEISSTFGAFFHLERVAPFHPFLRQPCHPKNGSLHQAMIRPARHVRPAKLVEYCAVAARGELDHDDWRASPLCVSGSLENLPPIMVVYGEDDGFGWVWMCLDAFGWV